MFGLQASDFRRILDFVSPSFFEVVPARILWSQTRALMASRRDRAGFDDYLQTLRPVLRDRAIGITLIDADQMPADVAPELSPAERGEAVLRLYFAQLHDLDGAALDLRFQRFRVEGKQLQWSPRPLLGRFSPEFLRGIRDLYAGFYNDDTALFHDAAARLQLTPAVDLFVEHFGPGDQTAVEFDLDTFKDSFHGIFVRCKDKGVRLDPGFISLGAYLGALYEHLSQLGTPLNVRRAFEAVWTK